MATGAEAGRLDPLVGVVVSAAAKHIALGAYSERQAHQTIGSGIRAGANRPSQQSPNTTARVSVGVSVPFHSDRLRSRSHATGQHWSDGG
jgi:hypothetical protein